MDKKYFNNDNINTLPKHNKTGSFELTDILLFRNYSTHNNHLSSVLKLLHSLRIYKNIDKHR